MTETRGLTRRSLIAGMSALGLTTAFSRSQRSASYRFVQFHNQPAESSLHRRLAGMWRAIAVETGGLVETEVFPENNRLPGSDPAALAMLVRGEIQFFTLMGGILGNVVPVADVQQVPFAFRSARDAHRAMDGALGAFLRAEMAAKGIHTFGTYAFDNGMRQIAGTKRPIAAPDDLAGIRIRVPAGQLFDDTFRALGAEPVTINVDGIYDGLRTGVVDAQENPLAVIELFRLYEVATYVSMTNHMWSGFNLMANLGVWNALPDAIKGVIDRHVEQYVRLQRQDQEKLNDDLRAGLAKRGLAFNDVPSAPFRARLSGVYSNWKARLGARCWALLEAETGKLG